MTEDQEKAAFDAWWDENGLGQYREQMEAWRARSSLNPWLLIETAPKDFVTEFDGWNGERVANVSWAHPEYSARGHYDWCISVYETGHGWVNERVTGLTHWMPLPKSPT